MKSAERADAPNPAIVTRLQIGRQWRGVGDPQRWVEVHTWALTILFADH